MSQATFLRSHEELDYVLISEVAEDPLDPNCVVLRFKVELLDSFEVEIAPFWTVILCLLELNRGRLDEIYRVENWLENMFRHSANACTTVESRARRRQQRLELIEHCFASVTLNFMDAFVAP